MALALTWSSRADLELKFSEFFGDDFTISAWFMPQFPDCYIGPIIGVGAAPVTTDLNTIKKTTPFFVMGTGTFGGAKSTTRMFLRVGGTERHFDQPLKRDSWHHVALVRDGDTFTLFVNGSAHDPIVNHTVKAISGVPVRLGSTSGWHSVSDGRPAQFYGLIDDVAVFTKALSAKQIGTMKARPEPLAGDEPGLLAGWPLTNKSAAAKKLKRKVELQGVAKLVATSAGRNSAEDAEQQPMPVFQFALPVADTRQLYVGQSPFGIGGSHSGARNFPYDLSPVKKLSKTGDVKKVENHPVEAGVPFFSISDGTVSNIHDGVPPGITEPRDTNAMFVSIDEMPHYWWKYLHWASGTAKVKDGDKVKAGQLLADIGDSGQKEGNIHHHVVLVYFPDDGVPPDVDSKKTVSIPYAFVNYFALDRSTDAKGNVNDQWNKVEAGIPSDQVIVTTPPVLPKVDKQVTKTKPLPLTGVPPRPPLELEKLARMVVFDA